MYHIFEVFICFSNVYNDVAILALDKWMEITQQVLVLQLMLNYNCLGYILYVLYVLLRRNVFFL